MYELERIKNEALLVSNQQNDSSIQDAIALGVGLFLFWPVLLFIVFIDDYEQELSVLKGEFEALEQAAIFNKCMI